MTSRAIPQSREQGRESGTPPSQDAGRAVHGAHSPQHVQTASHLRTLLGVGRRDYLTMEQLAAEFGFPSGSAARQFVHRHHVPFSKRGRRVLVDRPDMQSALDRMTAGVRRTA